MCFKIAVCGTRNVLKLLGVGVAVEACGRCSYCMWESKYVGVMVRETQCVEFRSCGVYES